MRRLIRIAVLFAATALACPAAPALAQRAVIVVRHAEKISEEDQRLSEAGVARSKRLAEMLKVSGISAIYATNTERAIWTARPLADGLNQKVEIYDTGGGTDHPPDATAFVEKLRKEHANDTVLVVGHSNTIPDLLKKLGCAGDVTIGASQYDDLFVVAPKNGGKAELVRLKY
jgi:broad specificity phosphatase PhoE